MRAFYILVLINAVALFFENAIFYILIIFNIPPSTLRRMNSIHAYSNLSLIVYKYIKFSTASVLRLVTSAGA